MQTRLSPLQLARPGVAEVDAILRKCVHCGFCNATCPTHSILGDELDGPRGRIYQVKAWLEEERAPTASDVTHIDRCLSCLACVTTCPAGVDYMHLVDFARAEVEASAARTPHERRVRAALGRIVSDARLFRWALRAGRVLRPFARFMPARVRAMLDLVPERENGDSPHSSRNGDSPHFQATEPRRRVALLRGCVQDELRPEINESATRVLARLGCDVVEVSGCCGALAHHLGQAERARHLGLATARALHELIEHAGVETIVATASGCGTMLKDYAHVFHGDGASKALGREIASRTRDVSELIGELGGAAALSGRAHAARGGTLANDGGRVAVHSPCSIHHGQRLGDRASPLLAAAGYRTVSLPDPHLCCGSAGVYNILQPQLARELRARKVELIRASGASVVATGNIGCLVQIRSGLRDAGVDVEVRHVVELLDAAARAPSV
jgi:glycolate oxidase iron-sulfur subunit